jgi:dUTP pyrophosphatase
MTNQPSIYAIVNAYQKIRLLVTAEQLAWGQQNSRLYIPVAELEKIDAELNGHEGQGSFWEGVYSSQEPPVPELKILPCSPEIPLPSFATEGSAGMDLAASEDIELPPGKAKIIHTGLRVEVPPGHELQIRPRSGLALCGIQAHFGTIDSDYRGEIGVILINHGKLPYPVTRGDRIAQAVLSPICHPKIVQVLALSPTARGSGGFGSTGR